MRHTLLRRLIRTILESETKDPRIPTQLMSYDDARNDDDTLDLKRDDRLDDDDDVDQGFRGFGAPSSMTTQNYATSKRDLQAEAKDYATMDEIESMFGTLKAAHPYIKALKAAGAPITVDTLHWARVGGCKALHVCADPNFAYTAGTRSMHGRDDMKKPLPEGELDEFSSCGSGAMSGGAITGPFTGVPNTRAKKKKKKQ